jgi:hypothetical protein
MIPGMLNGEVVFYWQTDKNVPMKGDMINYEGVNYEVLYRYYTGMNLQLILRTWPE